MELFMFKFLLQDFMRPKRMAVWIGLALIVGLMAFAYTSMTGSRDPGQQYPLLSSVLAFKVLPLAAAIFSTAVVAAEVEQKTIVYLLTRPMPRGRMLLSRLAAAIVMVSLVGFVTTVIVAIACYRTLPFGQELFWRDVPAIFVGSAAYCTFFVFLSLLMNRSMIASLLYAFAWETSIPNMPGQMYVLSISSYLTAIAERPVTDARAVMNFLSGGLGTNTLTAQAAWATMIGFILILGGISTVWFTRFEYTPREDAE